MTVAVVNNWPTLGVTGRVDVDALTVGGSPVTASNGTVTSASVVSANGFAGTVATATTTPAVTLTTTVTGVVKGNGTAISAATSGTDYSAGTSALASGIVKSTTTTGALSIAVSGTDYSAGTSALASGILLSTTTTGALSIAVANDFPTLNQSTTGNAATASVAGAVPTHALSALPSVTPAGTVIYVSDATRVPAGTGTLCFSDGTNWVDVTTGVAVV